MDCRAPIMLLLPLLINGCVCNTTAVKAGRPALMEDVYAQTVGQARADAAKFIEENLKARQTFGYIRPYFPVVEEPLVRKVWIPDHSSPEDANVFVGGHWVYLMIKGRQWSMGENAPAPAAIAVPAKPLDAHKP